MIWRGAGAVGWMLVLTPPLLFAQEGASAVSGVVRSAAGPVAGAIVRVQASPVSSTTGAKGEFHLSIPLRNFPAAITAYAPGHYIAGPIAVLPNAAGVQITLKPHHNTDDPSYQWLSAYAAAGLSGNCENCHAAPGNANSLLPFDEWSADAHGGASRNRRFLSVYNGTDLSGRNQSPPTRFAHHKDYGRVPLPPDLNQPYFGPGLKLDFPNLAGNCAACHLPNAAVNAPYDTDPDDSSGAGSEGVGCDFCHRIWAVKLNPNTGLPYPNTPGVLGVEFRRPSEGHQLFIGPFDDVAPGEDTYSELQNQSQICAPCHYGQFWGVQIYNSFCEWLDSPYADPVKGKSCQDCHMPHRGARLVARADKGGVLRDASSIFSHQMPGAADVALLQDTAKLSIEARQDGSLLRVKATVTNEKAGHHMPTDHPSRNILLVVAAKDAGGRELSLVRGPTLPEWAGAGNEVEDYAGQPGRGYAKILEELWTEVSPAVSYWNPTILREDTRIPALASDTSEYEFRVPAAGGRIEVKGRLIFRRAFRKIAAWKQWDTPDILMEQADLSLNVPAGSTSLLSVVSAASYSGEAGIASGSIAAAFADALTASEESAGGADLPFTLAGVRVTVVDRLGISRPARLFSASSRQINFQVPEAALPGAAMVQASHLGQVVASGPVRIAAVAPGLFTANGDGRGVAAATAVRISPDGKRTVLPVYRCTGGGNCTPAPLNLGEKTNRVVLSLLGTGVRGTAGLEEVAVTIGGVAVPLVSVAPQGQVAGLDQADVVIPHELSGRGEVDVVLTAAGRTAKPVKIRIE